MNVARTENAHNSLKLPTLRIRARQNPRKTVLTIRDIFGIAFPFSKWVGFGTSRESPKVRASTSENSVPKPHRVPDTAAATELRQIGTRSFPRLDRLLLGNGLPRKPNERRSPMLKLVRKRLRGPVNTGQLAARFPQRDFRGAWPVDRRVAPAIQVPHASCNRIAGRWHNSSRSQIIQLAQKAWSTGAGRSGKTAGGRAGRAMRSRWPAGTETRRGVVKVEPSSK